MQPILGYEAARSAQTMLLLSKASLVRRWDKAMFDLEVRKDADSHGGKVMQAAREN